MQVEEEPVITFNEGPSTIALPLSEAGQPALAAPLPRRRFEPVVPGRIQLPEGSKGQVSIYTGIDQDTLARIVDLQVMAYPPERIEQNRPFVGRLRVRIPNPELQKAVEPIGFILQQVARASREMLDQRRWPELPSHVWTLVMRMLQKLLQNPDTAGYRVVVRFGDGAKSLIVDSGFYSFQGVVIQGAVQEVFSVPVVEWQESVSGVSKEQEALNSPPRYTGTDHFFELGSD